MHKDAAIDMDALNEFIEEKMGEWQVPGAAVGIVKDGEAVFAEGFGYRNVQQNLKATQGTVMPIGSVSKSFTSLALGILADEGRLDWDKPVREYIQFFKVYDASVSDKITVRDMLCHRTGLPRHDATWMYSPKSRKEIVEYIQFLQPSAEFRTKLQYQNHMFTAAGYIVEAITGKTWEQFVQERIFDRLGMKDTNFSVSELQKLPDHSRPYFLIKDKVTEGGYLPIDALGPAGSINSTAADMSKYLIMQLAKGKYRGEQIASEKSLGEMHTPQIPGTVYPWRFEEVQFSGYGLGWFIDIYRGHKVIHHGGNIDGFTALAAQLPEKNTGIVILTNMNSTFLTMALMNVMIDRILGLDTIDWPARYRTERDKLLKEMDEAKEETEKNRIPGTCLSHRPEDYAGRFEHPAYGSIEVAYQEGVFRAKYNEKEVSLSHYHYDTFELEIDTDLSVLATCLTNCKGGIDGISVPFEQTPGIDPIVFRRM